MLGTELVTVGRTEGSSCEIQCFKVDAEFLGSEKAFPDTHLVLSGIKI